MYTCALCNKEIRNGATFIKIDRADDGKKAHPRCFFKKIEAEMSNKTNVPEETAVNK